MYFSRIVMNCKILVNEGVWYFPSGLCRQNGTPEALAAEESGEITRHAILVMILSITYDHLTAINLFQKKYSHHLVGKSHFRKR